MPVYISTLPQGKEFKEVNLSPLRDFAEKLLRAIGREDLELSVVLTDDPTIWELNRTWRGKDKPTDVLSFPQDFPPLEFSENLTPQGELLKSLKNCRGCKILGDIVISVDTAKRQAQQLGWSLEEELKRLLLHGFVHLLGFDHETSLQAEEKFKQIENLLLEKVKNLT